MQAENEPGVANRFAQSGKRKVLHALHDQHIDLFFDQGFLEKFHVLFPGFIDRIRKYPGLERLPVLFTEQLLLQQGGVDQNAHTACMEEIGEVASDGLGSSAREGPVVEGYGSDLHGVCAVGKICPKGIHFDPDKQIFLSVAGPVCRKNTKGIPKGALCI